MTQSSPALQSCQPLLSICIPSYNRRELVVRLVETLLQQPGSFEIHVHDDGSTDGTREALVHLDEARLHVTCGQNAGRAAALAGAVAGAAGKFTMLFDDDDELWPEGLDQIIEDCERDLPDGVAGYVYHLQDDIRDRLGDEFPVCRSNFLQLRNDLKVRGDKKEIVLTHVLKPIIMETRRLGRRVPTSLYWTRIALNYDVVCRNICIGRKRYHKDGMSDQIRWLKNSNPRPLVALYRGHISGFKRGRFRSRAAAIRALLALGYYYTKIVSVSGR